MLSPPTIKKLPSSLNNKLQVVNNKLHTSDVEEFEKGAEGDDDDGEFNGDNDDDGDLKLMILIMVIMITRMLMMVIMTVTLLKVQL